MTESASATAAFRAARDLLLRHREDYEAARREFTLARARRVQLGARLVRRRSRPSTRTGRAADRGRATRTPALTYAELAARSAQVANWLRGLGVRRGDRVLLMLGNMRAAVGGHPRRDQARRGDHPVVHAAQAGRPGRPDRRAGNVRHVITGRGPGREVRRARGDVDAGRGRRGRADRAGWHALRRRAPRRPAFTPDGATRASDPLLLYFTSGTTAQPKLVAHTHGQLPRRPPVHDVLDRPCSRATCT